MTIIHKDSLEFELFQQVIMVVFEDMFCDVFRQKSKRNRLVVQTYIRYHIYQFAEIVVGEFWFLEGVSSKEIHVLNFRNFLKILFWEFVCNPFFDRLWDSDGFVCDFLFFLIELCCIFLEFIKSIDRFFKHFDSILGGFKGESNFFASVAVNSCQYGIYPEESFKVKAVQ